MLGFLQDLDHKVFYIIADDSGTFYHPFRCPVLAELVLRSMESFVGRKHKWSVVSFIGCNAVVMMKDIDLVRTIENCHLLGLELIWNVIIMFILTKHSIPHPGYCYHPAFFKLIANDWQRLQCLLFDLIEQLPATIVPAGKRFAIVLLQQRSDNLVQLFQ